MLSENIKTEEEDTFYDVDGKLAKKLDGPPKNMKKSKEKKFAMIIGGDTAVVFTSPSDKEAKQDTKNRVEKDDLKNAVLARKVGDLPDSGEEIFQAFISFADKDKEETKSAKLKNLVQNTRNPLQNTPYPFDKKKKRKRYEES